jgi:protein phosphatase-4 regulatory subunit 3
MRSILRNHRFRRDARTLDDDEEMWFNADEDELEDGEAVVPPSDNKTTKSSGGAGENEDLMDPISKFMERKKRKSQGKNA